MNSQFRAGNSGGERISDTVGTGSKDFDTRLGMLVPRDIRARAANSVADMLRKPGTMKATSRPSSSSASRPDLRAGDPSGDGKASKDKEDQGITAEESLARARKAEDETREDDKARRAQERNIFDGLCIYVNGSTLPLVSDHKLKHLLAEYGARISLHLGRRQVTHVILGRPSGPNGGAGGGLAGGKLEKEIRRVGGCGIKFVGVEWYVGRLHATATLLLSSLSVLVGDPVCVSDRHGYCAEPAG
jgi:hypothetical protein